MYLLRFTEAKGLPVVTPSWDLQSQNSIKYPSNGTNTILKIVNLDTSQCDIFVDM